MFTRNVMIAHLLILYSQIYFTFLRDAVGKISPVYFTQHLIENINGVQNISTVPDLAVRPEDTD